jgi:GNAT superfamily N-acetyltransferase
MVLLHAGGLHDTFVLRPTYADLYTLVAAAEGRGRGIGAALFSAVEAELAHRSITELEIAVMASPRRPTRRDHALESSTSTKTA